MVSRGSIPLYRTIAEIASLWAAAEIGYRVILPLLGYGIGYNEYPIAIALYYGVWFVVSLVWFKDLLSHIRFERRASIYAVSCIGFGLIAWAAFEYLATRGTLEGPPLAPYTDMLFATPWYFLPKSVEILVQQTLIAALVLALHSHVRSMTRLSAIYAITFGGTHFVLYALSGAPTPYALVMTLGATASSLIFPRLIVEVKSGFLYAYMIHVLYYILFVLLTRTWPPPGYGT